MNNSCFSQNLNSIDCLRKAIRTVSLRATVSGMLACLLACLALGSVPSTGEERDKNKTTNPNLQHCLFPPLKKHRRPTRHRQSVIEAAVSRCLAACPFSQLLLPSAKPGLGAEEQSRSTVTPPTAASQGILSHTPPQTIFICFFQTCCFQFHSTMGAVSDNLPEKWFEPDIIPELKMRTSKAVLPAATSRKGRL